MASPTVYKWTDPGAPQINRADVADYIALFQAVLIDGYGTKTPPVSGANKWTIPFSDGTSFILKQGGTQARKTCIKIGPFNSSGYYAEMECAVDYTDLNTPVDIWAGTTTYDRVGVGYADNTTRNIPWIIFATERAIYCQFGYINSTAGGNDTATFDVNASTTMYNHHWFFGDYTPEDPAITVNQCVSFSNYSLLGQFYSYSLPYANAEGYGKKRCAGNAGNVTGEFKCIPMFSRAIDEGAVSAGGQRTDANDARYPNLVNGGLYLDKVKFISERVIMGEFPGLLFPIQSRPFPINGIIHEIDGSGDYAGEKLYVFGTFDGQYFLRDGDWGVD